VNFFTSWGITIISKMALLHGVWFGLVVSELVGWLAVWLAGWLVS